VKTATALALLMIVAIGLAYAASEQEVHSITLPTLHTELKDGPGKMKTETLCAVCHSVDYITMQPKFSRAQWSAEVTKMIKVMGASISEEDATTITGYLTVQYGTGN